MGGNWGRQRLMGLAAMVLGAAGVTGCASEDPPGTSMRTVQITVTETATVQSTTAEVPPVPNVSESASAPEQTPTASERPSTTSSPRPEPSLPHTAKARPTSVAPEAQRPTRSAPRATPSTRHTSAPQRLVPAEPPLASGCNIKGNINSEGEKIYHLPSSATYNATKISPQKGERMFCSEQDALNAGWRAARD